MSVRGARDRGWISPALEVANVEFNLSRNLSMNARGKDKERSKRVIALGDGVAEMEGNEVCTVSRAENSNPK